MTSPTPKVLTEADLAGLPRAVSTPNDLPSVGTEDARPVCNDAHQHMALVTLYALALTTGGPRGAVDQFKAIRDHVAALVSERDDLAARVRELEGALREVEVFMSDLLRESLEAEGFTGQQLDRMVVMAKAPHITKPDSPLGKVIAALTASKGQP